MVSMFSTNYWVAYFICANISGEANSWGGMEWSGVEWAKRVIIQYFELLVHSEVKRGFRTTSLSDAAQL